MNEDSTTQPFSKEGYSLLHFMRPDYNEPTQMRIPAISSVYSRIERPLIYSLIAALVVFQMVISIFPSFSEIIPSPTQFAILLAMFFIIFRYIDEGIRSVDNSIDDIKQGEDIVKTDFSNAIEELLSGTERINQLEYLGFSSGLFLPQIRSRNIHIKEAKISVYNPEGRDAPLFDEEKENKLQQRINGQLDDWETTQNVGNIDNVTVKGYPFQPVIFCLIINNERGAFGFFQPSTDYPYIHGTDAYIINSEGDGNNDLIEELHDWFNVIYSEQSDVLYDGE